MVTVNVTPLEYKFKKGEKVRIRPGSDLLGISIVDHADEVMRISEHTIVEEATLGSWKKAELNDTLTYTIGGVLYSCGREHQWRIPESFLEKV